MLSKLKENIFFRSFLVGFVGLLASYAIVLNDFLLYDIETLKTIWTESSAAIISLLIQTGVISFIITFLACLIGIKLSVKIQKDIKKQTKKETVIYFGIVCIVPIIITIIDFILFKTNVLSLGGFSISELLGGILYSGMIEEVWFRFGLMTLIIFAAYKLFSKQTTIPTKYFLIGLIFSSLFLFVWQLYAVFTLYYFNILLLFKIIISYLVMSLFFGYVYLKHGLKYSILYHIVFVVFYVGICPLFLSILI